MIALADDFKPFTGWDKSLRECAPGAWWEGDKVVWVTDGYSPDIFTLGIITRRRYLRFGYFFYPLYLSLFSDTEHTAVARLETGSVIDARHLLFEHLHPDCGKRDRDPLDLVHASQARWNQGEMLFNLRRDTGFPLDQGPVAERLEPTYQNLRFAVHVQAIRDDLCLYEVVARLLEEANGIDKAGPIEAVFICSPDEYWSGKAQSDTELCEVEDAVVRLAHNFPEVAISLRIQKVAPHRIEGRSRIMVETAVRNEAIELIRAQGYEHILIVDGDELWNPGLFAKVGPYVQEYRPNSIYTGMIPVVGLPGYPVEGATDKATIYVGPGAWCVECRGVSGHRHELPGNDIIHFTATRRTREEIAQKMLESGHADDPSYDFVTWNREVLPNLCPGFTRQWTPTNRGVHMFLPYQVWPTVRAWRVEEWKNLPASVKQYLAAP